MTKKGIVWTIIFLSTTALAIAQELWASFDSSENTIPWTFLLVDYVPWPIWLIGSLILAAWLPRHLIKYYRTRHPRS